jgi:hypothetical protein
MKIGDRIKLRWAATTKVYGTNKTGLSKLLEDGFEGTLRHLDRAGVDPCWDVEFDKYPGELIGCCESFLTLDPVAQLYPPVSNGVCVCSTHQLMWGGCKCGGK